MPSEAESNIHNDHCRLFILFGGFMGYSCVAIGPHLPETSPDLLDSCKAICVLSNDYMCPWADIRATSL